jgi:hypothetical protein
VLVKLFMLVALMAVMAAGVLASYDEPEPLPPLTFQRDTFEIMPLDAALKARAYRP